ncbi:NIPSNAP family protein [Occallatibacter savannae]|uniref:NIPSNAP family protein n=1 Tax=Occallatibacter savannae TaxID=1002691 RepID=UPI000D688794|nr:NIPSNAP family protein [Occallatibacter savannae]
MERRDFLAGTLAASALAIAPGAGAQTQDNQSKQREYYQIRRYFVQSGPQSSMTEKYISEALIPALAGRGGPVGAFRLDIGPETPTFYVLIPLPSPAAAASLEVDLNQNETYIKAAEPFWSAPASSPGFIRVESSLLAAFEGWPRITPPEKGKRIFQLRTYESPSLRDHVRKVEMFHSGEFDIFKNAGFHQVFYGDTVIGPRMPNLTYMLSFADHAELDAKWEKFRNDPTWKKLSSDQKYAFEPIVSNITNLILSPLAASQI